MSNEARESALRKIQGLLKKANCEAAGQKEAEVALQIASNLMAKHGIEDTEVRASMGDDGKADVTISHKDIVKRPAHDAARVQRWDWRLLSACATASDCRTYRTHEWDSSRHAYRQVLMVYGLPADVAVCLELFSFARKAMRRAFRQWADEYEEYEGYRPQPSGVEGRSFKDGFSDGLYHAAHEAKREQKRSDDTAPVNMNDGTSTALVPLPVRDVIKAKENAVAKFADTALSLRNSRRASYVQRDGGAYGDGHARGSATSMSRRTIR